MAAPRTSGARKDTFLIGVQLSDKNGVIDLGVFDTKTGGDADSDDVQYYPGGLVGMISLGGKQSTANVTLQRLYDRVADGAIMNRLFTGRGKAQMTVTQWAIDDDGNQYPPGLTWKGKLKRVLAPDVDSNSTDAALLELEISVTGSPVAA